MSRIPEEDKPKVTRAREKAGISRTEFSRQTGIPLPTLEGWSYGRSRPAPYVDNLLLHEIKRISNPLKLTEIYFVKGQMVQWKGVEYFVLGSMGDKVQLGRECDDLLGYEVIEVAFFDIEEKTGLEVKGVLEPQG